MGDSAGSMFYAFTIFVAVYFAAVLLYYGGKFMKKLLKK